MSTYSNFHTFSTSFIGSVGRPFATRYLDGFGSVLSNCEPPPEIPVSHGIRAEKGLLPFNVGLLGGGFSSIVRMSKFWIASPAGKPPKSCLSPAYPRNREGGEMTWAPSAAPFRPLPFVCLREGGNDLGSPLLPPSAPPPFVGVFSLPAAHPILQRC